MIETIATMGQWITVPESSLIRIVDGPLYGGAVYLSALMENRRLQEQVRELTAINKQLTAMIDSKNKPGFLYWMLRSELLTEEEKRKVQERFDRETDFNIFEACHEAVEQNARGYERMARNGQ